jgi:histidine triad (HIT) family protein
MKPDCLFCKLSRDPATVIWENADFAAFKDIRPKARIHLLVVPKQHADSLNQVTPDMAAGLIAALQEVARNQRVDAGYKVHINVGRAAGQEVDHVHAHLLAT